MECERCKSRPASLQVRRVINGRQEQIHLCQACAEEVGLTQGVGNTGSPFSSFPGFGRDFDGLFSGGLPYGFRRPGDPLFDMGEGRHAHHSWPEETEAVNILDAFSDRAKGVVQRAAQITHEAGSAALDTEHLLIGVAEEPEVGRRILENLDINPDELAGYLKENMSKDMKKYAEGVVPDLSPRAKKALELAWHAARNLEHDYVGSEHLLIGLLEEGEGLAAQTLKKYGLTDTKLRQAVLSAVGEKGKKTGPAKTTSKTPTLDTYSRDLTHLAKEGKLDPVIGRSNEVQRVIQILSRRTKNNPVLIGEPGIGKTAIVEGLAARIVNGTVPETLKGKRALALDLPAMVAGTKYRGEFEDRIKKVIEEVTAAKGDVILFIDELHSVVGAGSTGEGGTMDAANILKPALARGELQMIGATTLNEYKKHIEKDGALERRFQPVMVEEPTPEEAIEILRGLKDRYEAHHKVTITDDAIVAAVRLSHKYLPGRFLPDKAIDLMDEAAAKVRLRSLEPPAELVATQERLKVLRRELASAQRAAKASKARSRNHNKVTELKAGIKQEEAAMAKLEEGWRQRSGTAQSQATPAEVESIISAWTGIPIEKLTELERERLLHLEEELHKRVIAQDEAVRAASEAIRRNRAGLKDPRRPQGSFLFLGPTGVGKTELSRALAEVLFGSRDALVRLDMSEYMEKHAVSRMIGSPPGYVGHEAGGQLTEAVRRKPYSVILFDEIEKAHPDVFNILLQVLEDGRLTDGQGRTVDFRNTLIIMTSNVGSDMVQAAAAKVATDNQAWAELKQFLLAKLKQTFRPEFLNRVDEIIIFHPLEKAHVQQIADLLLADLQQRVRQQGLELEISAEVRNRLAQDGFDPQFGARPLKREIQQRLENKLSTVLLSGQFPPGSRIRAILKGDDVAFERMDAGPTRRRKQHAVTV